MKRPTYEAILRNPDLLEKLIRDARRERAEAMWKLLIAAIGALSRSPTSVETQPTIRSARELAWPHAPALELAVRRAAWKWFRQRVALQLKSVLSQRATGALVREALRSGASGR
jgi:hypothetical protein